MRAKMILLGWLFLLGIAASGQRSPVFIQSGKAISGYDAVSYFTKSKPIQGNEKFVYSWNGAKWYFESADNLKAFSSNPDRYAPQYGGYCAYGMANGYKAPTEKDAWTIVNGKLYLNYNKEVQKLWVDKQSEFIGKADKNWPSVKTKE
jgi:YHS domain-containing protein